jgi:hypothetical protein
MNDIQDELRSRIDAFVDELAGIVRQSALEAVRSALGEAGAPRGAPAALPSRGRAGGRRAGRRAAARAVARPRTRPGQKRDPKVLTRLVERLVDGSQLADQEASARGPHHLQGSEAINDLLPEGMKA